MTWEKVNDGNWAEVGAGVVIIKLGHWRPPQGLKPD